MKVLFVSKAAIVKMAFIQEQKEALINQGVIIENFLIEGEGWFSYLKNYKSYLKAFRKFKPDIIHAHYGLSGMFAVLQKRTPVVITFHGSDINLKLQRKISFFAGKLASQVIFVSNRLNRLLSLNNSSIIPCGLDLDNFKLVDKQIAKKALNLESSKSYILFSSSSNNSVKNYPLAQKAFKLLNDENIELLELKGYNRKEVNLLMNAVDLVLMTSFTEGSPQFIKEAMACNCPIVSTDVGDVKDVIKNTKGCYITSYIPEDVATKIELALNYGKKTDGREHIKHFDNELIALKILNVYKKIIE